MALRSMPLLALCLATPAAAQQLPSGFFAPLRQVGDAVTAPAAEPSHPTARVGAMVGLLSVPRPLSAELFAKLFDVVGVGASYSALPAGLGDFILSAAGVKDASVESSAFDGEVRVFPFRGSFFFGSALGRQGLTASATRQGRKVTVDMTTIYATPRLGWLAIWDS